MPVINNLEQQFSNLSSVDTLTKDAEGTAGTQTMISPSKSAASGGASIYSSSDDEEASHDDGIGAQMLVKKTDHKLKEEQGMLSDEPLLKENPYRFVLFPIQDNDVR